ncbi:hypothetical protein [Streptomyces sp. NPDC051776]|uniref:hypothetical protein n=1 Tax=Streptomyces sp. NPDC051776 TaxID=3155414 RepID=UPI00341B03EE
MRALRFADAGEAADLAAFLARLLHYDRRAAVRLQAGAGGGPKAPAGARQVAAGVRPGRGGGRVLAVFGRPASFEVLAIRTARLDGRYELDVTVSAGRLADAIDAAARADPAGGLTVTVPESVTGPPWAGVLPPRGGWQRVEGLPDTDDIRAAVAAAVAEFRERTEELPDERRTRAELDRIGREIWSRTLGTTELPLRAVHAAQSLGFLRRLPAGASAAPAACGGNGAVPQPRSTVACTALAQKPPEAPALFAAGSWLRLRTAYGSIVVRRTGIPGLIVTSG